MQMLSWRMKKWLNVFFFSNSSPISSVPTCYSDWTVTNLYSRPLDTVIFVLLHQSVLPVEGSYWLIFLLQMTFKSCYYIFQNGDWLLRPQCEKARANNCFMTFHRFTFYTQTDIKNDYWYKKRRNKNVIEWLKQMLFLTLTIMSRVRS